MYQVLFVRQGVLPVGEGPGLDDVVPRPRPGLPRSSFCSSSTARARPQRSAGSSRARAGAGWRSACRSCSRTSQTPRAAQATASGTEVGAEAGARLAAQLAMPVSADSLLRLIRRAPLPVRQTPEVLGADHWALRRGATYGTILVDLEARQVVDLLADRTAATLDGWLRRHPDVQVIARDRSTEYTRAATDAAPHAIQVADRWLTSVHPGVRRLPPLPGAPPLPTEPLCERCPPEETGRSPRRPLSGNRASSRQADGGRSTTRCVAAMRPESLSCGSAEPSALHMVRCGSTPRQKSFPSGHRTAGSAASSTRIWSTSRAAMPTVVRTPGNCGARSATSAIQER